MAKLIGSFEDKVIALVDRSRQGHERRGRAPLHLCGIFITILTNAPSSR